MDVLGLGLGGLVVHLLQLLGRLGGVCWYIVMITRVQSFRTLVFLLC